MAWEYRFEVLGMDLLSESEAQLNSAGLEGWEVIAMMPKMGKEDSWTIALLKRPVGRDKKLN